MDFKLKYFKYKKKYLFLRKDIFKQMKGGVDIQIITQDKLTKEYTEIPNKGTQNCGVFNKNDDSDKILICNYEPLPEYKLDFLLQNLGIYPKLYTIFREEKSGKYYYLWEKMDGDLRRKE